MATALPSSQLAQWPKATRGSHGFEFIGIIAEYPGGSIVPLGPMLSTLTELQAVGMESTDSSGKLLEDAEEQSHSYSCLPAVNMSDL